MSKSVAANTSRNLSRTCKTFFAWALVRFLQDFSYNVRMYSGNFSLPSTVDPFSVSPSEQLRLSEPLSTSSCCNGPSPPPVFWPILHKPPGSPSSPSHTFTWSRSSLTPARTSSEDFSGDAPANSSAPPRSELLKSSSLPPYPISCCISPGTFPSSSSTSGIPFTMVFTLHTCSLGSSDCSP